MENENNLNSDESEELEDDFFNQDFGFDGDSLDRTTVQQVVKERERRLVITGFILHDFEKFPNVPKNCR